MLKKAFTLIELLVVIAIIAILSAGGIVMYTTAKDKANDSNRLVTLKGLELAVEQFKDDFGKIPTDSNFKCLFDKGYLKSVPKDIDDDKDRTATGSGAQSGSAYDYRYARNTADATKYELSVNFAASANDGKETKDNGGDNNRYEIGTDLTTNTSNTAGGTGVIYSGAACNLPL